MNIKLMTLCLALALAIPACADKKTPIAQESLPKAAQTLIATYFKDKTAALIVQETEGVFSREYEITFTDGANIDFDKNGEWKSISCMQSAVPSGIVPAEIKSYVATNYPTATIIEIERDKSKYERYEIKLDTRLEITFNKNFQVVELDY